MKPKSKLLKLWLILPLTFIATEIIAQTTTHDAAAADSGKTAWMIVGAVAFTLMIMNLKHSIKRIYINLFTKKT